MEKPVFSDLKIKDNVMSFAFGSGEIISTYNMELSLLMECSSDDDYFYSPLDCILAGVRDAYKYVDMPIGDDPREFGYTLMSGTYLPYKNLISYKKGGGIERVGGVFIDFLAPNFPKLEIEITADDSEGGGYLDVEKYQCNINDMADAVLTTVIEWLFANSIVYYSDNWGGHTFPIYNLVELAKVRYGKNFKMDEGVIKQLDAIYNKSKESGGYISKPDVTTIQRFSHNYNLDLHKRINKVSELLDGSRSLNAPIFELVGINSGWVDIRYVIGSKKVFISIDVFRGVLDSEVYNPVIKLVSNKKEVFLVDFTVQDGEFSTADSKFKFSYGIIEWPVVEFKIIEDVFEWSEDSEDRVELKESCVVVQEEINAIELLNTVINGSLNWLYDNSHKEYHFNMFAWDHSGEFPLNTLIKLAKMLFQVEGELTYGQEMELLEAAIELNK